MDDLDFDSRAGRKQSSSSRRRQEPVLDDDDDDDQYESTAKGRVTSSIGGKPQPQARKASGTRSSYRGDDLDDNDDQYEASNSRSRPPPVTNSRKPMSGWDDDETALSSTTGARSHRRELGTTGSSSNFNKFNFEEDSSQNFKKVNKRELNNDDDLDIPEIPDLDEQADYAEDMAFKVAEAPDVQVHQISTYKELDKEFFKEKAFQFLEGNIDVSLLHCGLNTEQQIIEEDAIWEWNKLFTEIVSVVSVSNEKDTATAGGQSDDMDFFAESTRGARNNKNNNSNTRRLDMLADTAGNQQQTARRGSTEMLDDRMSQPPQSARVSTSRNQNRNRRQNNEEEFFSMN